MATAQPFGQGMANESVGMVERCGRNAVGSGSKWCAEPSVHGGKARPKGAKLVIHLGE